jgi:hypothetical protein
MSSWMARGQAGPLPAPVMQVTAAVTSCRHDAGPAVLDQRGQVRAGGSVAEGGGDVGGTDQIPMPAEAAGRAAESAARRFRNPSAAGWAGGGGAALIHHANLDAGPFGLVAQRLDQVGAAPLPQPQVVDWTGAVGGDAGGVADRQHADPVVDGEGDDVVGSLVVSLVDAAAVTASQSRPPSASKGDRPDLFGRVRNGASQSYPQRGVALDHRQPHPPALELKVWW